MSEIEIEEDEFTADEDQAAVDAQRDVVVSVLDAMLPGGREVAEQVVPEFPAPSPSQRLRIHVPNVRTTITAGRKANQGDIRPEDAGDKNYDGFGVHTDGHVFIDAVGADSKMTLQAKSDVTIQSQGGLAIGGKGGILAGSQSGATLYGGGGVTIYGGQPALWGAEPPGSDGETQPEAPTWVDSLGTVGVTLGSVWAAIDAAWAFRDGLWKAVNARLGKTRTAPWSSLSTGKFATAGGVIGGVASGLGSVAWAPGLKTWAGHWSWPFGGTTIHGTAGLIMGSGATAALYSLLGTAIATPASLDLFGGYVGMAAAKDMNIRAAKGGLVVGAGKKVEVIATEEIEIASRTMQALIYGSSVKVGKHSSKGTQDGTDAVTIDADQAIELNTTSWKVNAKRTYISSGTCFTAGASEILLSSGGPTQFWSFGKTLMHSMNEVKVAVDAWVMKIDKSSLTIGKANKAPPPLPEYKGKKPELRDADGSAKWWKDALKEIGAEMDEIEKFNKKADQYNAAFADSCHIEMKSSKMILNVGGHQFTGTSSDWKAGSALVVKK